MPNFREVTDRLCLSAGELAELFGRPVQSIRQMRLDPEHPSYRPPPTGWERTLAPVARARGGELVRLADELEKEG